MFGIHCKRSLNKLSSTCLLAVLLMLLMPPAKAAVEVTEKLQLFVVTNISGCKATSTPVWKNSAGGEGNLTQPLQVGDAYKLSVKIVKKVIKPIHWRGTWKWETKRSCGKKKCVTKHTHIKTIPVNINIMNDFPQKVSLVGNGGQRIVSSELLKNIGNPVQGYNNLKASDVKLLFQKTPNIQHSQPSGSNSKPDPKAKLAPPGYCAKVASSPDTNVLVAEVDVTIVRRN